MKIVFENDAVNLIKKAASFTSRLVKVYEFLRLQASGTGEIRVTGAGSEGQISQILRGRVLEPGDILVKADILIGLLQRADKSQVTFQTENEHRALLKIGKGRFKIPLMPATSFPMIEFNPVTALTVKASPLLDAMKAVAHAMGRTDPRITLNSLRLEVESDRITTVATDGQRLATSYCPLEAGMVEEPFNVLLPSASTQKFLSLLADMDEVGLSTADGFLHVKSSTGMEVIVQTMNLPYVNWRMTLPKVWKTGFTVSRDELLATLGRSSVVMAFGKPAWVDLNAADAQLTVKYASDDCMQEEGMEIENNKEQYEVRLNPDFMMDALRATPGEKVCISIMKEPSDPVAITALEPDRVRNIIMPMRR